MGRGYRTWERRHRQTKLIQQIIILHLINYLSSVPLSLSLFSSSISVSSMSMSLWSSHCWQSQNYQQLSPALTQLYLFIYLFIYLFALDRNTFSGCCLQNPVRCYFYSSWKHGMILSVGRRFLSAGHFTDFFSKSVFIVCTPHTLALLIAGLNVLKNHRSGGSRFPFKNGGRGIRNRGVVYIWGRLSIGFINNLWIL